MTVELRGSALVVHLFVAARGADPRADRAYLHEVWQRLRDRCALGEPVAGLPTTPSLDGPAGLLAGLRRAGATVPHVEEALLRREHDAYCLSVMREPAGATWAGLEAEWAAVTGGLTTPPGFLGSAHVFLARLPRTGPFSPVVRRGRPDPAPLTPVVRPRLPDPPAPSGSAAAVVRWTPGVTVSHGFAVWEASGATDERASRRLVVVAPHDADERLSGWTWVVGAGRDLPELGRYLLHAARLRTQLRVWSDEHAALRDARRAADTAVDELLDLLATRPGRPTSAQLLDAARRITALQAGEPGLVRTHTSLVEMRRTVQIAGANLAALSDPGAGGPFADDRDLGTWFAQQLDDDAAYVGAARERAGQVAALTDQLLQRRAQDERERFNLAFTGAIGAVLMVLAASQSFGYQPPLPPLVQPAVVALLGAVALLSTLLMLWIIARRRWWARALLWGGWGLVGATTTWVITSATAAEAATETATRWGSAAGFAAACALAALWSTIAARRARSAAQP
ncbi:CATRA conflict system CASPASE/TPR repeat-associated protein [Pseudonocardia humida]|uniref:Uncharacterized protein n=1 Tax=Pseudonocardia humida TaxID=2800819 RepID=A0ABT0ZY05_9PSEU|nr:CATRA conflict system CASPASE/TPR repeat-associated protein [Pseudonocardia humida]MCO1655629.1 hypothetical protein [Pseudonocardia humida]